MKVLYFPADDEGPAFYRMFMPYAYVSQHIKASYEQAPSLFPYYDLVIIQRQSNLSLVPYIQEARRAGVKVAYENDDNLFESGMWTRNQLRDAATIMRECDAIITSTEPLAKLHRGINPHVYVIPNYVVEPDSSFASHDGIRIGWAGSASHKDDFTDEVIGALQDVVKRHDNVELLFVGWIPQVFIGKAYFYHFIKPIDFLSVVRGFGIDIGIIPSRNTSFNICRSNVKYLEYSINRIATVASKVTPYAESISHGKNGLLVDHKYRSWRDALETLVVDNKKRKYLAGTAYSDVRSANTIENNIDFVLSQYHAILGATK